ncbi:Pleiotropic drug resistance protein ABC Superfamily [Phytophthora cinnamomi]|uniref:Pleiotropic drug resistance protein ABC Superfamily n=1 Tax=Phytophthora cinnamomi TaxID=4785 RepID=UPI003559E4F5|nr:Pleiotropic drug resistance protein ABC Superfamily [Phytophthora cinnamomi]
MSETENSFGDTSIGLESGEAMMAKGSEVLHNFMAETFKAATGGVLPQMEVRFDNVSISADVTVTREVTAASELPTLYNVVARALANLNPIKKKVVRKEVIKNVSGVLKPGTITLLLGQPGSGKTSLMRILSGQFPLKKNITVEDAVNGRDMKDEAKFAEAFGVWGMMYVSDAYSEQLEEELHAFFKRRSESVSECYKPSYAQCLESGVSSGITLKTMVQAVEYFKRLERFERRRGRNSRGGPDDIGPDDINSPTQLNIQLSGATTPLKVRVSSGCGFSYINARLVDANEKTEFTPALPGETVGLIEGLVRVAGYATVKFRFVDLQCGTCITHTFLVIPDASDDIVVGYDLLCALGLIVNYRDGIIEWNGDTVRCTCTQTYD